MGGGGRLCHAILQVEKRGRRSESEDEEMGEAVDLAAKAGKVDWTLLERELMSMPKETLVELVNVWLKTFWSLQNYWMVFTEAESGFETAGKLDAKVWEKVAPIQAYRVKKVLGLGDDVQALATVFKFTAPQWAPAGFEWEFDEVSETRLRMTVHECPMGTYRKQRNLELLPCKYGSPPLYTAIAKVVNEKFETTCLHAHPDPPEEGVMCRWECVLKG
jgi:hypothetical protein